MKNYTINHANKSIELTRTFNLKSAEIGTDESATLVAVKAMFPDYAITVKAVNTKKGSRINYNEMEKKLIASGNNELLATFNALRAAKTPFFDVRGWFTKAIAA